MNEELKISIYGMAPTKMEIGEHSTFEREVTYFKNSMLFEVVEHDGYHLVNIEITDNAFIPEKSLKASLSSKTGFKVEGEDTSFLKSATNPTTLSVCIELAQTAIAHNRMYMNLEADSNSLSITVPYTQSNNLIEIVKESLLASLN